MSQQKLLNVSSEVKLAVEAFPSQKIQESHRNLLSSQNYEPQIDDDEEDFLDDDKLITKIK